MGAPDFASWPHEKLVARVVGLEAERAEIFTELNRCARDCEKLYQKVWLLRFLDNYAPPKPPKGVAP